MVRYQQSEIPWGLRSGEVRGRHLLNLHIWFPTEELRTPVRTCLTGESQFMEITDMDTNRQGRQIKCHVSLTPLLYPGDGARVRGVILVMEEVP